MAVNELERKGWHLTEHSITDLCSGNGDMDEITKKTLDVDLKDIGAVWLNEDINNGKLDLIKGPCVLQLVKLRSVSSPQDEDLPAEAVPYICLLILTDGHITCSAVTLEPIENLSLDTPPGSKLLLSGSVEVESNFLLLSKKNTILLGGWVESLAEPWKLKKTLAKEAKTLTNAVGEGAPPPFVPFGQKIVASLLLSLQKDNFKSLNKTKERKITDEEIQFQQLRQAALKEAMETKKEISIRNAAGMMEMDPRALRAVDGHVQYGYQNGGYRTKPGSSNLYKSSAVESSISSDLSHEFNRHATIGSPDGSRPPFHGQRQSMSYSQNKQGNQRMDMNDSNILVQHHSTTPQNGVVGQVHIRKPREFEQQKVETGGTGKDSSCVIKAGVISSQDTNLIKENRESKDNEEAQIHTETNQTVKPEKLQENEQKSNKNIINSQKEDHHSSPGQKVQKCDESSTGNQAVQKNLKEGTSNTAGHYVQKEQTKNSSSHSNSPYNKQQAPGAYQHQPAKTNPYVLLHDRQAYINHQHKRHLNVGENCLARYWVDGQFYPAVVRATPKGNRAVVMFLGFGNVEEVDIHDTLPSSSYQTYPVPHPIYGLQVINQPPTSAVPFSGPSPFMPAASFNNSGSYRDNRRHNSTGQDRPTQPYYTPPRGRY